MNLLLSPILLGVFTLFYLFLAMRIGYLRGSPVMKLIFKMDEKVPPEKLDRNIRAHGNFSEYVPMFFLLLLVLELNESTSFILLLTASVAFSYGRLAHAICFAFFDYNPFLRISGMIATYSGLALLALQCILSYEM
ncbi:MAG: MAPEG family protein [Cellvibrionales bacterium TMED148]|nr:glutathione S-transferase [Porticoccaceae bacterium]RPG93149.1 MAG: MAPEG family protein [Cellvibrionales bacterium TMED148]|tara:strand:- start:91 stop:498 length:408 start_codon:yes stop_codon:yes gene_type:complete